MTNKFKIVCIYVLILLAVPIIVLGGNKTVSTFVENQPVINRKTVIIDAGHGGVDGGATSCTGVLESQINLEIALKLENLMHLLGLRTIMIRRTDTSVYTEGETIAAKKVSDLKERVRIVNAEDHAVLISIHQNQFLDPRYSGAQVFYAQTDDSKELAEDLQKELVQLLRPISGRQAKKASGIYLMQHIVHPGILIECGFLSNPEEEALLRSDVYQKNFCCVVATKMSRFLANT